MPALIARLVVSCVCVVAVLAATAPPARAGADRPGALGTLPVPGGVDAVAEAAGLSVPAPRATIFLEVIRRLYVTTDGDAAAQAERRRAVAAVLEGAAGGSPDLVPLPFTEDQWITAVFLYRRPPGSLAHAILTTPRTAFIYYGGVGLDEETRAWFSAAPDRLSIVAARPAMFAAFAPSLRVRGGRVETPGGNFAAPYWEELVGVSLDHPAAFIAQLFDSRSGRLAWLYDTVARLDAGQQRHLFGADPDTVRERLRRLADVFEKVNLEWRVADRPFWRPRVDPAAFLVMLDAGPDGLLRVPLSPAAWAGTLGEPETVDAPWLAEQVFLAEPAQQRERFDLVRFAARWRARAGDEAGPAALTLYLRAPLLALVLERTGVTDDALAARLLAFVAGPAMRSDPHAPRLVQASLAFVERAHLTGTLDAAASRTAIAALIDRVEAGGATAGVAVWLADDIVPLARRLAPAPGGWDSLVAAALAGPAAVDPPRVEWEGQSYRVDRPAAERDRIARVHEAQGHPSLERAVTAARALGPKPGSDAQARAGDDLATALVALVYAAALPAADPELLASRVETRHDLDAGERPGPAADRRRWTLAEPVSASGVPWHLAGSLMALDVALAVPALRRVGDDPPVPVLPPADRLGFARTVALLRPEATTDASRDVVVRLVAEGRRRLAALAGSPADAGAVAEAAGLSAWRREALGWSLVHDPAGVARALSATELAWLGAPQAADRTAFDAWGTAGAAGELATHAPAARPWEHAVTHDANGGLSASFADLNLRIAAFLAERRLPAALARDVLSAATLELVDRAGAPRADDWRALVESARALSDTRLEDYVAALTADGPLRPVRAAETGQ